MDMAVIHIPEAEAARDFTALLARVRAGEEVVIVKAFSPSVVLRVDPELPLRKLSESLELARKHGSPAMLDGGFGDDLDVVIDSHREPLENLWD